MTIGQDNLGYSPFTGSAVQPKTIQDQTHLTVGNPDKAYSMQARKYNVDLSFADTDLESQTTGQENLDRDIDFTKSADQNSLLASDQTLLRGCITSLQNSVCDAVFSRRNELFECADKIFAAACEMESNLKDEIEAQIEDIRCQLKHDLMREFETRARIAGSSRSSYVVESQNLAYCDAMRKLAALQAQLNMDAIKAGQQSLVDAYKVKSDAAINGINAVMQNLLGLWQILKGARIDTNEEGHEDNVAQTNSTQASTQRQDTDTVNASWSHEGQQLDDNNLTYPIGVSAAPALP